MPVHDVGYRAWEGEKTPQYFRWWIISKTGVRLAAKSTWMKRVLFASWLPVLYFAFGFFFVEKAIETSQRPDLASQMMRGELDSEELSEELRREAATEVLTSAVEDRFAAFPQADQLVAAFESGDTVRIRREVWRWLLMVFFRYPQALLIVFLIGTVAPSLIARDIRSRAFLLYFSRPIGRLEYIFGKLLVPATFTMAVTTLPALGLYLLAIFMSPDPTAVLSTWDIPFRVLLATLALVIPTSSVALMLSSLTQESRYANFSWFALWILGHGSYMAVLIATAIQMDADGPFDPELLSTPMVQNWSSVSLYYALGDVQSMIFGFATLGEVWRSALVLTALTVVSLGVLYRRVSSPIRV